MTSETINTFEAEMEDGAAEINRFTERVTVAGSDLVAALQALLREGAVRKITVKDKTGRTLLEFPLYAGVIGAFVVGSWTVLALVAAWFAEVSILIERDKEGDGYAPILSGEYADRAADALKSVSHKTPESVKTAAGSATAAVSGAVGGAVRSASDLTKRAADTLEDRLRAAGVAYDEAAEKVEAAVEPQQCVALTKAGTRCKRTAVSGSDFCSTHQPLAN